MFKKVVSGIIALIALAVLVFALWQVLMPRMAQEEAVNFYNDLQPYVLRGDECLSAIPFKDIDWDSLRAINADIIAWIYLPNTPIDYPVIRADCYTFWLNHLPDRTWNANGSIFLDFNHSPDFSSPLSVLFGHNMFSGIMFNAVERYREQSFFDEHPHVFLYTPDKSFRVDVAYGFVLNAVHWGTYSLAFEENLEVFLDKARRRSTFESDVELSHESGHILGLSTCTSHSNFYRYILLGDMVQCRYPCCY